MKFALVFLVYVACGTLGKPLNDTTTIPSVPRYDLDIMVSSKLLVLDLVRNLSSVADQIMDSINIFRTGIDHQAHLFEEKVASDLKRLKEQFDESINAISGKFETANEGIKNCVEDHKHAAEKTFNITMEDITTCGRNRVTDIGVMIEELLNMTRNASLEATNTAPQLQACYNNKKSSIFELSKCVGTLALQTELKGSTYFTLSGLSVVRINMALTTLPAALEVCTGSGFLDASIKTARIAFDAGGCSASSIYNAMTNNVNNLNAPVSF